MKTLRLLSLLILAAFAPIAARGAQTFEVPLDPNQGLSPTVSEISSALATLQSSFSGTSAPTSPTPVEGQVWWDTTNNIFYQFNGSAWVSISLHIPLTTTTTTPYAITAANGIVLIDATAGNKTATLPTAVGLNGTILAVVKKDSSTNTVTIDPDGVETIGGTSTFVLARQYEAVTFTSDGAAWYFLSANLPLPVHPTRGGTGQTTITTGDLLYGSAANTLSKLAIGAATTMMYVSGGIPTWSTSMTYKQSATDANLEISAALAGLANRVKFQAINTDATGVAEFRAINDSSDVFAMLINGSNVVDSGLYVDRTAAIVGVASGHFLLCNESAAGDIVFAAGGFATTDESLRVLNTVGTRFAGPLSDLDDFVIELDENSNGSNKLSITDGASTEVAQITEAGNIQIDGTATIDSTLQVGGGATLQKFITNTATLDFASTAAGAVADLTITVTGAVSGDTVSIGVPAGSVTATAVFFGWVSAADTVTIRFSPKATEDPASGTFRATVTDF